jgi:hypothetical protein
VLGPHGRHIDYTRVEAQARAMRVSVRGGCFCNPGAAERAFAFPSERLARCLTEAAAGGFTPALPSTADDVARGVEAVAWWRDRS